MEVYREEKSNVINHILIRLYLEKVIGDRLSTTSLELVLMGDIISSVSAVTIESLRHFLKISPGTCSCDGSVLSGATLFTIGLPLSSGSNSVFGVFLSV